MNRVLVSAIVTIVLGAIVLGIFVFKPGSAVSGNVVSGADDVHVITLKASRFQYSPSTITVSKGEHVKIVMENLDTTHGIAIPDYGVSGTDSVEFVADKAGTFEFHCPTFCGPGHKEMTGTLIVQ